MGIRKNPRHRAGDEGQADWLESTMSNDSEAACCEHPIDDRGAIGCYPEFAHLGPEVECPTCAHPEGYDRLSGPCPTCHGDGVIPPERYPCELRVIGSDERTY
jgi:Zn finger protein HypA/HybF involved in hydrogenase expression